MGHCYHHALSSVRKWGGEPEDYLPLHQWFDQSKEIIADFRHRALRIMPRAYSSSNEPSARPSLYRPVAPSRSA